MNFANTFPGDVVMMPAPFHSGCRAFQSPPKMHYSYFIATAAKVSRFLLSASRLAPHGTYIDTIHTVPTLHFTDTAV